MTPVIPGSTEGVVSVEKTGRICLGYHGYPSGKYYEEVMKSLEARYLDRLAELYPSIAAASTVHAKYIVLLGVLRLLILVGIELCLTIIAHELLRSDVKTQISAAVRAIIHLLTLSAAAVDLCTSVSGQDSRTRCHLPACGCRCKTEAGSSPVRCLLWIY